MSSSSPSPLDPASTPKKGVPKIDRYFSANLGRAGRITSWVIAIGAVGIWSYLENQKQPKNKKFSKQEQEEWNKKVLKVRPQESS